MECEQPLSGNVLRQGDIIAAHPGTENWRNPWRRFGVILTADCDLEQQKGGANLVYIPVIGLKTYLADVWLPNHATALYETATRQAEKALDEFNDHHVTPRHLLRQSIEEIAKQLGMATVDRVDDTGTAGTQDNSRSEEQAKAREKARKKQFERVKKLQEALTVLNELRTSKTPSAVADLDAMLGQLFPQHEFVSGGGKSGPGVRRELLKSGLTDLIQDSRVDTWPISDLVAMDPEMRADEAFGFVVDLRRFSVLETAKIQTNRAKLPAT
ncbi:hypothetical protein [Bradyrhizobium sp. USDA 3650]